MNKITKKLFSGLFLLITAIGFSQGKIKGAVADTNGSLPGVNVLIKGTNTGTSTDVEGKFLLNSTSCLLYTSRCV